MSVYGVYVHMPFCIKKCLYCAFPVHAIGSQQYGEPPFQRYTEALLKEIRQRPTKHKLNSLYIGGGTPSLIAPQHIRQILNNFWTDKQTEITIEIMPHQQTEPFEQIGVNRFSYGIQTTNQQILEKMNRPQYNVQEFVRMMQNKKINYNLDIMLGIG